ncbi:MAG: TonB-dependent receptor [Calditrichaeota bacterium]|nr:MAG: TonB-dependent receptor [Calditrichota bacterium]
MKFKYITILCFLLCNTLLAQQASIQGMITDKKTGKALQGVEISLPSIQKGSVSDVNGQFLISNIPAGKYLIQSSHIGFKNIQKNITLAENQVLDLSFAMQESILKSVEEIIVEADRADNGLGFEVSSAMLKANTPDDIGDFFREIPNTSAIKKGAFCADPVIRGTTGEQLNLQVDNGIKIVGGCPNRMDPATAHMQSEDLQKIEVITGPYSVRFGPNMSGLVNMVMQKPENYSQFEIHSSFEGGYETISEGSKSRFTVNGGNNQLNFYLNAGIKNFKDYEDAKGNVIPANYEAQDYSFKTGYNFLSNHRLQFSARESRHKDVSYPALPMDAENTDTHIYALDYLMQGHSERLSTIQAKIYMANVEHLMGNLQRTDRTMDGISDTETKNFGARFEMQLTLPALDQLYIGSEFYSLNMDGLRTRSGIVGTMMEGIKFEEKIWPDAQQTHLGVFSEAKKSFSYDFLFSAGLRFDADSYQGDDFDDIFLSFYPGVNTSVDFDNVSFHGGVEYLLKQGQAISLKAGQGVRSPAIKELYINRFNTGNDGFEYLGNPLLEPEQNRQLDLTYSAQGDKYRLAATVFYSKMENYISAEFAPDIPVVMKTVPGVKQIINIDEAERKGGEFKLDYNLTPALSISNIFAYTHGQNITTDEPLMEIPPFEYKLSANYNFGSKNFIRINGRIVAEQTRISDSFKETETPGFNVWDVSTGYEIYNNFSLIAGVENVFDTWYREHLNRRLKYTGMAGQYFYEPGRNVYLYLKYEF